MKKLLALLLVLCTLVGLVACGKKEPASTNNNPTTGNNTSSDPTGSTEDPHLTVTPETSPYKGKTIEIYGMGTAVSYTNYDSFGKGNYIWMMKAAIEEWAAINGVTLVYKGSYNQNAYLAAVQAGDHPDLLFTGELFPKTANAGVLAPFTEEEYKKLSDICGKGYLDLMTYKNQSHGIVYPWVGNTMCYYNKTMFENYGVKTPKEYFMEGEWTWTNFLKCMEEMTKDIDSDGKIDTYGLPADSLTWCRFYNPYKLDENGRLLSTLDDPLIRDVIELKYEVFAVKKTALNPGKNQIQKNVTYPMTAMQLSDCEPYNFEHMYQYIANGDELQVVPVPAYDGDGEKVNLLQFCQSCVSLASACDEREAAVDLLAYLLKCGLKYVSDFSLGAVESNYVGMQGKCELSKKWKEAFAKVCETRAADIKNIEDYDEELIKKIYESFEGASWYVYQTFTNVSDPTTYSSVTKLPPASSIPAIKEVYQAKLDAYNDLYIK